MKLEDVIGFSFILKFVTFTFAIKYASFPSLDFFL